MTCTGTIASVNAALNGLSFSPTANYSGAASLSITTNDQGNTGAGGPLSATSSVAISINPVNDAPVIGNQGFSVAANSATGTVVGAVVAGDPDAGDVLTYSIIGGNAGGAFGLDAGSGQLTVANGAALASASGSTFPLVVQVRDSGGLTGTATVTVSLSGSPGKTPAVDLTPLMSQPPPSPPPAPTKAETHRPAPAVEAVPTPPRVEEPVVPGILELRRFDDGMASGPSLRSPGFDHEAVQWSDPAIHMRREPSLQMALRDRQLMAQAFDRLAADLQNEAKRLGQEGAKIVSAAEAITLFGSVALLAAVLRSGSLVALALSTLPLWRQVDPLVVLAISEEERWQREEEIQSAEQEEDREKDGVAELLDPRAARGSADRDGDRAS
jgi:hypothetical protein